MTSKNGFNSNIEKEKYKNSMNLIYDLRVSPFFPIEKVSSQSKIYKDFVANGNKSIRKTSWGELEIRNRMLTQHHLSVFSTIMAHKKKIVKLESGMIAIYFSMYKIAKMLGLTWSGQTSKDIEETVKQIADVNIFRTEVNGDKFSYRIIDKVEYSKNQDSWGIILSREYSNLFNKSLTIGYEDRLNEIVKIKGAGSGFIKSIIHFFMSHNNQQTHKISLKQLLETIGQSTEPRQIRSCITAINKNKETLKSFEIVYHQGAKYFEYQGIEGIRFILPFNELIVM